MDLQFKYFTSISGVILKFLLLAGQMNSRLINCCCMRDVCGPLSLSTALIAMTQPNRRSIYGQTTHAERKPTKASTEA